jgi:hypothetical protein
MPNKTPWNAVNDGTTTVTATHASIAGRHDFVSRISGHSDLDCFVRVLDGSDIIWEKVLDVSVDSSFNEPVELIITPGNSVSGVVSVATADCRVEVYGFSIP